MNVFLNRRSLAARQRQWDAFHAWERSHQTFPANDAEALRQYGDLYAFALSCHPTAAHVGKELLEHIAHLRVTQERLGRLSRS